MNMRIQIRIYTCLLSEAPRHCRTAVFVLWGETDIDVEQYTYNNPETVRRTFAKLCFINTHVELWTIIYIITSRVSLIPSFLEDVKLEATVNRKLNQIGYLNKSYIPTGYKMPSDLRPETSRKRKGRFVVRVRATWRNRHIDRLQALLSYPIPRPGYTAVSF